MAEKNLVEEVRRRLVGELKNLLRRYRTDWVNRPSCLELIAELEERKPTKIGGPLYSDFLDGVLYELGIRSRTDGRYEAIWKMLEGGE